jgi:hypothetical protein
MDIEKAIEFIMNSQANAEGRLGKVEILVASNAEDIKNLASVVGTLAQSMIESNKLTIERERRLDERIAKLVSGIGEFMGLNTAPIPSPPST